MAKRLNWTRDRERRLVSAAHQSEARTNAILRDLVVPIYATPADQADAIERAFAKLKERTIRNPGIRQFVASLARQWTDTRHLSPRQQRALFKIAQQKPKPFPRAMLGDPTLPSGKPAAVKWIDATPEQKAAIVAKLMAARHK